MGTYGYFDEPTQTEPQYDPGLSVPCPICAKDLCFPVKTISLMVPLEDRSRPERSYFYRTHKECYDDLDGAQKSNVDGLLVEAIISSRNTN